MCDSRFIKAICNCLVLAAIALAGYWHVGGREGLERPNIVFIYADDWRWDCLGVEQKEGATRLAFPGSKRRGSTSLPNEVVLFNAIRSS